MDFFLRQSHQSHSLVVSRPPVLIRVKWDHHLVGWIYRMKTSTSFNVYIYNKKYPEFLSNFRYEQPTPPPSQAPHFSHRKSKFLSSSGWFLWMVAPGDQWDEAHKLTCKSGNHRQLVSMFRNIRSLIYITIWLFNILVAMENGP